MIDTVPALRIRELVYTYPFNFFEPKGKRIAIEEVTIAAGEAFGFLGGNGAGKTTTIKCILNLVHQKSGSIELFGVSSTDPRARACVGYLPEVPYLYEHLTVEETVLFAAQLCGLTSREASQRAADWMKRLGIFERRHDKMKKLSKGLMQRVALIQAVIGDPKLVLLDEPFSGLDPIGRREFREIFFELKNKGVTLFLSSHILSDVEQLCDRVSIMSQGEIKGVYSVHDLLSRTEHGAFTLKVRSRAERLEYHEYKALGGGVFEGVFPDASCAQQALSAVLALGDEVLLFERRESPLEELFLQVVR